MPPRRRRFVCCNPPSRQLARENRMAAETYETRSGWIGVTGKGVGLALFVLLLLSPAPEGLEPVAMRLAACTVLMAVLWLTQGLPIATTSLIPLAAFPLLGIQTAQQVSGAYMNANIFLYMGGFIIALGIEKWGLHRRIALHIVRVLGSGPKRVVLGFMIATAFLSMWISNTASTLLMLPIGLAMLASLGEVSSASTTGPAEGKQDDGLGPLAVVLMLAIAYSASIGGLTTLVGTPTNIAFQQIWAETFPDAPRLSAGQWMIAFLPLGVILLFCAWGVLTWGLPPLQNEERLNRGFFTERLRKLGRPSRGELLMLVVFVTTAALWIFRKPFVMGTRTMLPGWGGLVEQMLLGLGTGQEFAAQAVHDSTVAIGMVLVMFCLPGGRDEQGRVEYLMDWRTAEKLPWGILLLFGGGFAIAGAFEETGLSEWIGGEFADTLRGQQPVVLVGAVSLLMTFLTEFTSNVATVSALSPILADASVDLGLDPRLIMLPATIATSCAFMLPIATPPNAIIFGSGKVTMAQMARYGIVLNLLGTVLIVAATFLLVLPLLGIDPGQMPDWAVATP